VCNTHVGDTDKIVQDYHSGILLKEFTVNAYSEAIEKMSAGFDEQQIVSGAKDYFSLENGVEKYAEVYWSVFA
ncbi:MAG: glycosyltransferase, partial [Bacteroidota bacterium]|nr:glycosyltransferase [Bacteroidota bacterium]